MVAKKPKHSKASHLAKLPDDINIANIVQHDNRDEYFVTIKSPLNRICPYCGSNRRVIEDSG